METQLFEHDIDENIGWPVPIVPVEIYYKPPESYRKKLFFECLHMYDILECRIVSDSAFLEYYNLKVLHEFGIPRILDDLNIIVILPKEKTGGQIFRLYDLVRVVVLKITKNTEDPEVIVTVDRDNLENLKRKPVLGLIHEDELPFYMNNIQHETVVSASEPKVGISKCCDPAAFPTYAAYLNNMSQFKNSGTIIQFMKTAFGVDPIGDFSSTPDFNGLIVVINEIMNADLNKALKQVNTAIQICTEDDLLASRLYVQRAKIKYHQQCYKVAASFLQNALKVDKDNSKALCLLQRIKRRHPEAIISLSENEKEENHKVDDDILMIDVKATNSASEMSHFHQNQMKRKQHTNGPDNQKKRKQEMKEYSDEME